MLRPILLAAGLSFSGATIASAAEHEVVMLGLGFFPEITSAAVGDTVVFFNVSDTPMAATAVDGTWSTGAMVYGERVAIEITEAMTGDYENALPVTETVETTDATADAATTGLLGEETAAVVEDTTETATADGTATEQTASTVEATGTIVIQ